MGGGQSVRETHFQPPPKACEATKEELPIQDGGFISVSNKMVERLVEDATLAKEAAMATGAIHQKGDIKEQMYLEILKNLDEAHTERLGLTLNDMRGAAARIELRTQMVSLEPICQDCKHEMIKCYDNARNPGDAIKCAEQVGAFTKCVEEAGANRLKARTVREAREAARRNRNVAHARETIKDLPPTHDK